MAASAELPFLPSTLVRVSSPTSAARSWAPSHVDCRHSLYGEPLKPLFIHRHTSTRAHSVQLAARAQAAPVAVPEREKEEVTVAFTGRGDSGESSNEQRKDTPAASPAGRSSRGPGKDLSPSTRSRRAKDWERSRDLLQTGKLWTSKVEGLNDGGARLRVGSLLAFLPFSQMEPRDVPPGSSKAEMLVGSEVTVQVIEANESAGRLVVSERRAARKRKMRRVVAGQVTEGVVSGITDYGAFVDLIGDDGSPLGIGGLVHVSELSWDPVISVANAVTVGQRVRAKVLRVDAGRGRLALSMKQVEGDPLYDTLDALLPAGTPQEQGQSARGSDGLRGRAPLAEELLGAPLPGLVELCQVLQSQPGILEVALGRQALERRVVSQDLELWLSNTPARDGQFTLVARAGRQVQEVFVKSSLDREGMKAAVLNVTRVLP